jgi:hypothetical protein
MMNRKPNEGILERIEKKGKDRKMEIEKEK